MLRLPTTSSKEAPFPRKMPPVATARRYLVTNFPAVAIAAHSSRQRHHPSVFEGHRQRTGKPLAEQRSEPTMLRVDPPWHHPIVARAATFWFVPEHP